MQSVILVSICAVLLIIVILIIYYCYRKGACHEEEEDGSSDPLNPNREERKQHSGRSNASGGSTRSGGSTDRSQKKYRVRKIIGEGAYGTVYLATVKQSSGMLNSNQKLESNQVAIKVVPCKNSLEGEEALKEYTLCTQLKGHPNVISVLDAFFDIPCPRRSSSPNGSPTNATGRQRAILETLEIPYHIVAEQYLIIVTNYFPSGTLFDKLVTRPLGSGLEEGLIWRWTEQLLDALCFCHERNIIHRDLKPSNILISASNDLALTDFGLSRLMDYDEYAKTRTGTLQYMSPEQVQRRYNSKADLWSVGCLIFGMCTSKVSTEHAVMMFKERQHVEFEDKLRAQCEGYSEALVTFMISLLVKSPSARPTAEEALKNLRDVRPPNFKPTASSSRQEKKSKKPSPNSLIINN